MERSTASRLLPHGLSALRKSYFSVNHSSSSESLFRFGSSTAATSRETLLGETAGQTSFVTEETLTRVDMRLSAGRSDGNDAARLLHLPDEALSRLESGEALADVLADVRAQAQRGVSAHPENTLYTQLAQSLVNWCALIEKTPNGDKPYARATMVLLCRELRRALANQ